MKLMNNKFYFFVISCVIPFVLISCSKLKEDYLTQPSQLTFHTSGIVNPNASDFHGNIIKENHWKMDNCQQCHGANFAGGPAAPSCLGCHQSQSGPEACNTCHGSFTNPDIIAPPKDTHGNVLTSILGVGAHYNHLYGNVLGNKVECSACHQVPKTVYEAGHIDSTGRAKVKLTGLAAFNIASNATYDPSTGTCAYTYCHGNFSFSRDSAVAEDKFAYIEDHISGTPVTVSWNIVDGSQKKCGSCHGLPPQGHIVVPSNGCAACHPNVVDENGNIVDLVKHINGQINVRLGK